MKLTAAVVVQAAVLGAALPNYGNPFPTPTAHPTYAGVNSSSITETWTGTGTASFQVVSPSAPRYSPVSSYSCDTNYCENGTS